MEKFHPTTSVHSKTHKKMLIEFMPIFNLKNFTSEGLD